MDQVFIGSCTNSSLTDLTRAAEILRGKRIADHVSLVVTPGTRQNYLALIQNGAAELFVRAGARVLECGCGPCVGIGQAVQTGGVSLRTVNRNFMGRCGTKDSSVYIAGPETAAASAVAGYLTAVDESLAQARLAGIREPEIYDTDDGMLLFHPGAKDAPILRGPNIKEIPLFDALPDRLAVQVALKLGDNVSTDEIAPSGAKNMANRANIPEAAKSTFERLDPDFWKRAQAAGNAAIVAGDNYGQGSSREHAALMPRFLGVRAVLADSFARIHRANLINFGILPLTFECRGQKDRFRPGDRLALTGLREGLKAGRVQVLNETTGETHFVQLHASAYEQEVLTMGGVLQYIKKRKGESQ